MANSKKIGGLINSEVALYINKSTVQLCMEYGCHVWAVAPCCYLEMLDRLQKWVCRTVSPVAAILEHLVDVHLNVTELVSVPYSRGRCTYWSDRL